MTGGQVNDLTCLHQEMWKLPGEEGCGKFGSGKVRLWSISEGNYVKGMEGNIILDYNNVTLNTYCTLGGYKVVGSRFILTFK